MSKVPSIATLPSVLPKNPFASSSLIKLNFLLSQQAQFDKAIILPGFCF